MIFVVWKAAVKGLRGGYASITSNRENSKMHPFLTVPVIATAPHAIFQQLQTVPAKCLPPGLTYKKKGIHQ